MHRVAVSKWCWPSHDCMNRAINLNNDYEYRWLLDQMAHHQMLFHVIVAHMEACRSRLVLPRTTSRPSLPIESEMHKTKAIKLLQRELVNSQNGVSDATIATTAYLSLFEASVGDMNKAFMYRNSIGDLVARRGGLETLKSGSGIRTLVVM